MICLAPTPIFTSRGRTSAFSFFNRGKACQSTVGSQVTLSEFSDSVHIKGND